MGIQNVYYGDLKFRNKIKEVKKFNEKAEYYSNLLKSNKNELQRRQQMKKNLPCISQLDKLKCKKNQNEIYRIEQYIQFLEKKNIRFTNNI